MMKAILFCVAALVFADTAAAACPTCSRPVVIAEGFLPAAGSPAGMTLAAYCPGDSPVPCAGRQCDGPVRRFVRWIFHPRRCRR